MRPSRGSSDVRALPPNPNLERLKNEAKSRFREIHAVNPSAKLTDAQLQIAREYGYSSWRELKAEVDRQTGAKVAVLLLNDDVTSGEFVAQILVGFFMKSEQEARDLILDARGNGKCVCGLYPVSDAEALVEKVSGLARKLGFPLKCLIEAPGSVESDIARAKAIFAKADVARKVREALAKGASAPDVARHLLAIRQDVDPDTAVWIRVGTELGPDIAIAFWDPEKNRQLISVMPEFRAAIPPEGADKLPTLAAAFGPSPPLAQPPRNPVYQELEKMVRAGRTAQEVASFLISNGAGGVRERQPQLIPSSAQFVWDPDDKDPLMIALQTADPMRPFLMALWGTDATAYPGADDLPTPKDIFRKWSAE